MTSISITTAGLPEETAAYLTGLIKRKLTERSQVSFPGPGECDWVIRLELDPTIGEEGYRILDGAPQELVITGNNPLGLLHGIGKMLRTADYEWENNGGGFRPGAWRGTSVPERKVRGMYFATHFRNFYHRAPSRKSKPISKTWRCGATTPSRCGSTGTITLRSTTLRPWR